MRKNPVEVSKMVERLCHILEENKNEIYSCYDMDYTINHYRGMIKGIMNPEESKKEIQVVYEDIINHGKENRR